MTDTPTTDSPDEGTAAPTSPKGTKRDIAELWLGILKQDRFWVPRGAWEAYADASCQRFRFDNGVERILYVKPNFDVEGVVEISDMDISHRQNVANFCWRKTKMICSALSDPLSMRGMFAASEEFDHQLWAETTEYLCMVLDDAGGTKAEAKRREWFEALPFITALRASVVAAKEARIGGPVLLDASEPEPKASNPLLDAMLADLFTNRNRSEPPARDSLFGSSVGDYARRVVAADPTPAAKPAEPVAADPDDTRELTEVLGWSYLGQRKPTRPGEWQTHTGDVVAATKVPLVSSDDIVSWIETNHGALYVDGSGSRWFANAGCRTGQGPTMHDALVDLARALNPPEVETDEVDEVEAQHCSHCGGWCCGDDASWCS